MTYLIAEAGINHQGDTSLARILIDVAVDAGADAVKFQLFHIDHLRQYQLSEYQLLMLKDYCADRIDFLCTPFDKASVDFLADKVPLFKIGSGQSNDTDFVSYINAKGKPIILSTGMSTMLHISKSLGGCTVPVTLLHCVSRYPTLPEEANLRRMQEMMLQFDVPIGYSDHTEGIDIALAAVAIGATVLEKHLTLDKDMDGPDHKASITPYELQELVKGVRRIEAALV
jgi:N,N'-diacetyllegionaminate synthase